jgi:hypothetical protein
MGIGKEISRKKIDIPAREDVDPWLIVGSLEY